MAHVIHPHHPAATAGAVPETRPLTARMEVFQRRNRRAPNQPTATITTRGCITLTQAAHTAMGSPDAVELLYDRAERIIGLRPAPQPLPHAFLVRPQRRTDKVAISAREFLRHYGVDHSTALRRPAWMDDGVLCVDLKNPGQVVTSNRAAS